MIFLLLNDSSDKGFQPQMDEMNAERQTEDILFICVHPRASAVKNS